MAIDKVNSGQPQDVNRLKTANQNVRQSSASSAQSAAAQPPAKAAQDAVSITAQAAGMEKMQRNMSSEAPFDKTKVESLKKAISSGHYKVNHEKLADKLLQFEDDLFGT